MKKMLHSLRIITFTILTYFILLINTHGQIFEGSYIIKTQAEVDSFNYTYVTGSLIIYDNGFPGEMTNLDGLSELDSVGGDFVIGPFLHKLNDINGLSGLLSVGGDFFFNNTDLTVVDALSSLTTIRGYLRFTSNDQLTMISFPVLSHVRGFTAGSNRYLKSISLPVVGNITEDFAVGSNDVLESISGLSNLHIIGRSLVLFANPSLTELGAFSQLTDINYQLYIASMNITNIDALSNLNLVNNIFIADNARLENVNGLSGITSIFGELRITNNPDLTNYSGLSNLRHVGMLSIADNIISESLTNLVSCGQLWISQGVSDIDGLVNLRTAVDLNIGFTSLTNLNGFSGLTNVTGTITISYNSLLTNIDGLSNLDSANFVVINNNSLLDNLNGLSNLVYVGYLWIYSSPAITNLDALKKLSIIEFDLDLEDNRALVDLKGLSNVKYIGQLEIQYNNALENLDGLEGVNEVGQYLRIENNPLLNSLKGLSGLKQVGRSLTINTNRSLRVLDGLDSLRHVEAFLEILNNRLLNNIDALVNLISVGEELHIINNPELIDFCGIAHLLVSDNKPFLVIEGNGANPSEQEIIEQCAPPVTRNSFIAAMRGSNEVPAVQTNASGGGMFILNDAKDSLTYWIRVCGLSDITGAHFHLGEPGTKGTIVKTITITGDSAHGVWTANDPEPLTSELIEQLLQGKIYVNVHTPVYPEGEIRGQLTYDKEVNLYVHANAAQMIPPTDSPSLINIALTLNGNGSYVRYKLNFILGFSSRLHSAGFYNAPAGMNGALMKSLRWSTDFIDLEGTWTNSGNQPLTPMLVADLLGCNMYVMFITNCYMDGEIRGQIYQEGISGMSQATAVNEEESIPTEYNLAQNYPNPFNPSTKIKFQIVDNVNVQLKIYDLLGREVTILIDNEMSPGTYEAIFDGSNLSSGTYIYKLNAGNFTQVKKLILLK